MNRPTSVQLAGLAAHMAASRPREVCSAVGCVRPGDAYYDLPVTGPRWLCDVCGRWLAELACTHRAAMVRVLDGHDNDGDPL